MNITAIATESSGGIISNVAFYDGPSLLGTVTSPFQGFTFPWINIPPGTHALTAVATDTAGATTTSLPVTITINPSSFPALGIDDNLLTKTDAENHTTTYQYDNVNRLLKTVFDDTSSISQTYDLLVLVKIGVNSLFLNK